MTPTVGEPETYLLREPRKPGQIKWVRKMLLLLGCSCVTVVSVGGGIELRFPPKEDDEPPLCERETVSP